MAVAGPGLPTPYLVVNLDVLERNVARMAATAARKDLHLRPHVKTHKCLEIARRQLGAGAVGITVATIGEAEVFVDAGFRDVLIAYPLWIDAARANRLRSLAERAQLRIGLDSREGADAAARQLAGSMTEVLVEVDSGHHRTGCQPHEAAEVATAAARAGLVVRGVFTFPGHGYGPGAPTDAATDEARALGSAAASLAAAGLPAEIISGGSTPTAELSDPSALTEIRSGVYVFGDAQQLELGRCQLDDVALTARATVISRRKNQIVLDAGSKTLGADRPTWTSGFGRLADHLDARITVLSEHHATVEFPEPSAPPELGSIVRVIPNHVCSAVNLADDVAVLANAELVDRWKIAARGANS